MSSATLTAPASHAPARNTAAPQPPARPAAPRPWRNPLLRSHSILPGFNLSLGISVLYLSLIVLIPLATVFVSASELSLAQFWRVASDPQVVASYKLTFGAGKLLASYAQTRNNLLDAKRQTLTVGYDYNLSKRTDLYTNVMHDRITNRSSGTSYGIGLRHRF